MQEAECCRISAPIRAPVNRVVTVRREPVVTTRWNPRQRSLLVQFLQ
jgi:hypothetical protein